jgi:hypothetical protein
MKWLIPNFLTIFRSFGNVTSNYNIALVGNSDSLYEMLLYEPFPGRQLCVRAGTACRLTRSHPPWFDHRNHIWRRVLLAAFSRSVANIPRSTVNLWAPVTTTWRIQRVITYRMQKLPPDVAGSCEGTSSRGQLTGGGPPVWLVRRVWRGPGA